MVLIALSGNKCFCLSLFGDDHFQIYAYEYNFVTEHHINFVKKLESF